MHTYHHGRHEHGQNFLTDRRIINQVVRLVTHAPGPILEVGAGTGSLTVPIERLGRAITAVEIHPGIARELQARTGPRTDVVVADFLQFSLPRDPHVIVGNLPFHLTTAILRKLLHDPHWSRAVLITQWEVARRRAGVGGSTMMTAQWAPFYEFSLAGRIPARAYTPAPTVDGGIMTIARREIPLIPWKSRRQYAQFVHRTFTGQGRGITQILRRSAGTPKGEVSTWLGELGITPTALPKELTGEHWAGLFSRATGPGRGEARTEHGPKASGKPASNRSAPGEAPPRGRASSRGRAPKRRDSGKSPAEQLGQGASRQERQQLGKTERAGPGPRPQRRRRRGNRES